MSKEKAKKKPTKSLKEKRREKREKTRRSGVIPNYSLGKVQISPMCALRRLTGLNARRGLQQMALVLCKKHNTAGRPVSHALRGFHSNGLSALSDFDRPRHAFSQMP